MLHKGFHDNRLTKDNPREIAFSIEWEKHNDRQHGFQPIQMLIPGCTERDTQVASTVIQWLGSNCGMSFLYNVIKESPEIRQWFGK